MVMGRIAEAPRFDEQVGRCGVEGERGPCNERGVARVMVAAFEYDHSEWGPYVGEYVRLAVCAEHRKRIEDEYQSIRAAEEELQAQRQSAEERVAELEAQLEAAKRARDRI